MPAGIFHSIAGFVREFAEIHLPGMRGKSEHVNICAGAENAALGAVDHHGTNLRMLEANAVQRIVQFDIDAHVV